MAKQEEIIIIKIQTDLKQPVQSIDELQKRMKLLKKTLKESPKEGTKAFEKLAKEISSKTGVSIDKARGKILDFQKTATKEIQKGTNSLKQFNAELREIPANANSIQSLRNQVKRLDKEVSQLDTSTQEFVDKSQELRKTRDRLKELEAATGDARRNVGNYTDAIKKAIASNLNFSKRLQGLGRSIKIAFGFGAIRSGISTLSRVYSEVIEKNKETDSEINQLANSTNNLKSAFSNLALRGIKALAGPLLAVLNLVTKFFNFISGSVPTIKEFSANSSELKGKIDGLNKSFAEETAQSQVLFTQLKKTNISQQEKKEIVDKINEQYGQYLPNLLTEESSLRQIEAAQKAVNRALTESFTLKIQQATLEDSVTTKVEEQLRQFDALKKSISSLKTKDFASFQEIAEILNSGSEQAKLFNAVLTDDFKFNQYAEKLKELNPELSEFALKLRQAKDEGTFVVLPKELSDGSVVNSVKDVSDFIKTASRNTNQFNDSINQSVEAVSSATEKLSKLTTTREKSTKASKDSSKEAKDELTRLEFLAAEQGRLVTSIKERLLAGEDVSTQIKELTQVTKELTGVDEEFEAINKQIEASLSEIAEGSLKDYENQINLLKEQQENLNTTSQEYINLQTEINELSNKQALVLDLMSQSTAELTEQQRELNAELTDGQAQQAAVEAALERISKVTDATGAGAEQIKQIEADLAEEIKQINLKRLVANRELLTAEITDLEAAKQKELELVEGNEQLKLAIEQKFETEKTQLQIDRLSINSQLLDAELEKEKQKNAASLQDTTETETAKTAAIKQGLSAIGQAANGIFQIISNLQSQAFDKQTEQLKSQEEAALRNAELTGANEKRKQAIRDKFAKKQEELEKEQAEKKKAIAITQAVIQTALAVATAATLPPPASYAAMAIAAALGAIQIGIIATQKFSLGDIFDMNIRSNSNNKFAKGTYLSQGAYHSQGGMPIINPYTGQKVAEIEKDEAIVNRRTMRSNKTVTMTGRPYDIVSSLNSMEGFGVSYPNARSLPTDSRKAKGGKFGGGYSRVRKPAKLSYGNGGSFGVSSNILRLQQGAVVASTVIRQAQSIEENSMQAKLLEAIVIELQGIKETNKTGFEEATTTTEDLEKLAQLQIDQENAS